MEVINMKKAFKLVGKLKDQQNEKGILKKADTIIDLIDTTLNKALSKDLEFNQFFQSIITILKDLHSLLESAKNTQDLSLETTSKLNLIESKFKNLHTLNLILISENSLDSLKDDSETKNKKIEEIKKMREDFERSLEIVPEEEDMLAFWRKLY